MYKLRERKMFIYTVKLKIKEELKEEFAKYLYEEHLPEVVATGCFLNSSLEVDTSNSDEMMARYNCESQAIFDDYIKNHADTMRSRVIERYPDAIIKVERNFCKEF